MKAIFSIKFFSLIPLTIFLTSTAISCACSPKTNWKTSTYKGLDSSYTSFRTWIPGDSFSSAEAFIHNSAYEPILNVDEYGSFYGGLANITKEQANSLTDETTNDENKKWTVSHNSQSLTLKIKEDVKWSRNNGTATDKYVTVDDFANTFNFLMNPFNHAEGESFINAFLAIDTYVKKETFDLSKYKSSKGVFNKLLDKLSSGFSSRAFITSNEDWKATKDPTPEDYNFAYNTLNILMNEEIGNDTALTPTVTKGDFISSLFDENFPFTFNPTDKTITFNFCADVSSFITDALTSTIITAFHLKPTLSHFGLSQLGGAAAGTDGWLSPINPETPGSEPILFSGALSITSFYDKELILKRNPNYWDYASFEKNLSTKSKDGYATDFKFSEVDTAKSPDYSRSLYRTGNISAFTLNGSDATGVKKIIGNGKNLDDSAFLFPIDEYAHVADKYSYSYFGLHYNYGDIAGFKKESSSAGEISYVKQNLNGKQSNLISNPVALTTIDGMKQELNTNGLVRDEILSYPIVRQFIAFNFNKSLIANTISQIMDGKGFIENAANSDSASNSIVGTLVPNKLTSGQDEYSKFQKKVFSNETTNSLDIQLSGSFENPELAPKTSKFCPDVTAPFEGVELDYHNINFGVGSLKNADIDVSDVLSLSTREEKIAKINEKFIAKINEYKNKIPSEVKGDWSSNSPIYLSLGLDQEANDQVKASYRTLNSNFNKIENTPIKLAIYTLNNVDKEVSNGNISISLTGWNADYGDPYNFLYQYTTSGYMSRKGSHWEDAKKAFNTFSKYDKEALNIYKFYDEFTSWSDSTAKIAAKIPYVDENVTLASKMEEFAQAEFDLLYKEAFISPCFTSTSPKTLGKQFLLPSTIAIVPNSSTSKLDRTYIIHQQQTNKEFNTYKYLHDWLFKFKGILPTESEAETDKPFWWTDDYDLHYGLAPTYSDLIKFSNNQYSFIHTDR